MRSKTLILTSLFALGLAGAANATVAKPAAAPHKVTKVAKLSAKAEAAQDKVEAKTEAKQDRMEAKARAKKAHAMKAHAKMTSHHSKKVKVATRTVKTPAKPAATHG